MVFVLCPRSVGRPVPRTRSVEVAVDDRSEVLAGVRVGRVVLVLVGLDEPVLELVLDGWLEDELVGFELVAGVELGAVDCWVELDFRVLDGAGVCRCHPCAVRTSWLEDEALVRPGSVGSPCCELGFADEVEATAVELVPEAGTALPGADGVSSGWRIPVARTGSCTVPPPTRPRVTVPSSRNTGTLVPLTAAATELTDRVATTTPAVAMTRRAPRAPLRA